MICSVSNGVVNIPVSALLPANTPFSVQLNNIMNPTQGSTHIIGQVTSGSTIVSYNSAIGPVVTKPTPYNLQMTLLTTSSNAL